jgi:chemotaxis protein histidine kinase CheA
MSVRIVLSNDCLDTGDWALNAHHRLRAMEIAVWYPQHGDDELANPTARIDSSASKKSQPKRKSDQSDLPETKRSKEEDLWRTEINNSLATLTSIVQQLAAKNPQEEAPPVPPRSEEQRRLIEDVRQFVQDNTQTSTPVRPLESGPSQDSCKTVSQQQDVEETFPKQKTLPSGRIPRKTLPTASKSGSQGTFQFSTTYQDYEEYQSQTSDHDQYEFDLDKDQDVQDPDPDNTGVDIDLGRLEKRKMHLAGLAEMCPDLKTTQPDVSTSGRFGLLKKKPKDNIMPFLTEMFEQISLNSVVRERRPRDPFMLFPKFYPTTEPAESGILQGRPVPREVVDLVSNSRLIKPAASGRKAILRNSSAEGAKDEAAQRSFKQACGYIRIANNVEIDVEVMQNLMRQIGSIVSDLDKVRNLPVVAKAKILQLSQKVRLMDRTIFDVQSSNADLARGSLYQYQSALFDRRSAWISASMILKGAAAELKGADFPRPSAQDEAGGLDMFGPEGTKVLKEYDVLAKDGKVPTPQNSYSSNRQNQSRGRQFSGQFHQGGHRGGHSQGQGRGQSMRSRGHAPSNRRPRNNYRGPRGNRGGFNSQPFSQATNTQRKD